MISAIEEWHERTNGTALITTHGMKLAREHLAILGNGPIVTSSEVSGLLDAIYSGER